MKILIFGATGGVGREAVRFALDRGYEVDAFVRNPEKLRLERQNLRVIQGELSDEESVRKAMIGIDAVISALGPSLDRKATGMPLVEGTRNIVDAMEQAGVKRFIGMATPSLKDPRDRRSLLGLIVPVMGRLFLKRAYRELLEMSQVVTGSSLDWTIARFTRPTDGEASKEKIRAGFLGVDRIGASITRSDIASFLVEQVEDRQFERAAPAISS